MVSFTGLGLRGRRRPSRRSRQRGKRTELRCAGESLTCDFPRRGPPLCGLYRGGSGRFTRTDALSAMTSGRAKPVDFRALQDRSRAFRPCSLAWKLDFRRKNCRKNADFGDLVGKTIQGSDRSNAPFAPRCALPRHDTGRRRSIGEFFPDRRSKHHCREPRVHCVGGLPLVDGFPFPKGTGLIRGQSKKNLRWLSVSAGAERLHRASRVEHKLR
jgi:hypothetical protein